MKLLDIIQLNEDRLTQAQQELKDLIAKAGYVGQGAVAPQYQAQYDRLKHEINAIKTERRAKRQAEFAQAASRDFERDMVTKRAAETPEAKEQRRRESISAGLKAAREYRNDNTRDYTELAAKVFNIIRQASNDGMENITTEVIAQHFPDVSPRTIDKWLERPEFRKSRMLLGRGA